MNIIIKKNICDYVHFFFSIFFFWYKYLFVTLYLHIILVIYIKFKNFDPMGFGKLNVIY